MEHSYGLPRSQLSPRQRERGSAPWHLPRRPWRRSRRAEPQAWGSPGSSCSHFRARRRALACRRAWPSCASQVRTATPDFGKYGARDKRPVVVALYRVDLAGFNLACQRASPICGSQGCERWRQTCTDNMVPGTSTQLWMRSSGSTWRGSSSLGDHLSTHLCCICPRQTRPAPAPSSLR